MQSKSPPNIRLVPGPDHERAAEHPEPARTHPLRSEDVFADHADQVRRWVARLAGVDAEVDDLVQEVFLIAHRRLATFRGEARVSTWLFGITRKVVSRRRRRGRWARWFGGFLGEENGDTLADSVDPEQRLQSRERVRLLYRALETLPEKQMTTLVMFEVDGRSGEEIARLMNCSIANVWVRIHRGRAGLIEAVGRLQNDP